jgi:ferric-dicitrate binding protein FerR (iron transport regulator)
MKNTYWTLIAKHLQQALTEEERQELADLKERDTEMASSMKQSEKIWEHATHLTKPAVAPYSSEALQQQIALMKEQMNQKDLPQQPVINSASGGQFKSYRFKDAWPLMSRIAAVITLALLATAFGWWMNQSWEPEMQVLTAGKSPVSIILEDGTKVWLYRESSLFYPETFQGVSKREVTLKGRAFFDVAKKKIPFLIRAEALEVAVLGTSFDLEAHPGSPKIALRVQDGVVSFSQKEDPQTTIKIYPNEEVIYDVEKRDYSKTNVQLSYLNFWQDGALSFSDHTLSDIAHALSEWYSVDIQIAEPELANMRMKATFKEKSIEEVMAIISEVLDASCQFEGKNRILIRKS